jgi:hypothetical protein
MRMVSSSNFLFWGVHLQKRDAPIARSALEEAMAKLQDFIALHPDARSCKESVGSKAGLSRLLV